MQDFFRGKRILVTGGCGSVGSALVAALLQFEVEEVRCLDSNEEQMFLMDVDYAGEPRYRGFVGDISDMELLPSLMSSVDYVIQAAALKHVPSCERAPTSAINTNILGVQNVIAAARSGGVRKVLFTSSDKAVNPTNVMGTTKLMGERLITAANLMNMKDRDTAFFSTRFGNVAGSRGSVIPVFERQIAQGKPITLTDPRMTRFMMTLAESVQLILQSLVAGRGGEVFITKMKVVRIEDLANAMISRFAHLHGKTPEDMKIDVIGIRAGEKLYEELMTSEEQDRARELKDMFVVLPAQKSMYRSSLYDPYDSYPKPNRPYVSEVEEVMTGSELDGFLDRAYSIT